MGLRTLRLEPGRVIVPALVIFGLDAFQSTWFTEIATDHLGLESVGDVVVFGVSTLGLTFYSGMLERLVGAVERNQTPQSVSKVLATLPWIRLILAEVILLVVSAVASLLLIVPGLIIATLLALVGPLINLLDSSVPDAFRRSVRLVWPHFWIVFVMITLPLAIEHELVVLIADVVPHENVFAVFFTNFALGVSIGVVLGLIEVSLAERLISGAQGPAATYAQWTWSCRVARRRHDRRHDEEQGIRPDRWDALTVTRRTEAVDWPDTPMDLIERIDRS